MEKSAEPINAEASVEPATLGKLALCLGSALEADASPTAPGNNAEMMAVERAAEAASETSVVLPKGSAKT